VRLQHSRLPLVDTNYVRRLSSGKELATDQSFMTAPPQRRWLRLGLQLKGVLIVAFLVVCITMTGGWLYYQASRAALYQKNLDHAVWRAEALALAPSRTCSTDGAWPSSGSSATASRQGT